MFSWSQVENSELKLILVLAWSSYSPPHTPRMNSLPARWKKESRGWGGEIISDGQNHILFASCPSVLLLGSRVQTLQWRVPPVTRSCCGFRKHRTVSAPMGFVCLFSPPLFPRSWEGRRRMTSQETQSDEDGSHLDLQSPRKPCWLTPVVSEARQDSLVSSSTA